MVRGKRTEAVDVGWSLREGRTFLNAEPRFARGPVAAVWDKVRQSSLTSFRSRRGAKQASMGNLRYAKPNCEENCNQTATVAVE